MEKDTGQVVLVADCQTYVKSLHQMHLHYPSLILVPDTFLSTLDGALAPAGKRASSTSLLLEYIQEEFPNVQMEPVGRRYWNDSGGLEFVMQLCVENDERAGMIMAVSNKYYALSAACALFKYVEGRLNTRFAAGSLRVKYIAVEGTMMIDPDTARNLELVGNMTYKKSPHSLFGVLHHTFTPMALRLLRANILSPITQHSSIEARLDVVEELIDAEDRFTYVRDALKPLNKMDLDKLIVMLASSEAKVSTSAKPASQRVLQMLNLRSVVKNVPLVRKALEGSNSQLLRIIHDMINDERIDVIDELVSEHLNDECAPAKGSLAAVNARVYAVKANCNRLLDVARETYKENIGDIYQLNRKLSEEHELPLTLVYQETGFVFVLKKADLEGELPRGFVNPSLKKGRWMFSSMELKKMNARMKDALDETLLLSDKVIQDLVAQIVSNVGALYKASEAIALLDMLWSFAHVSIMRNYVRPEFTGTLAIKSGRHPILETLTSAGTLVPNDVYCDNASCFQIIQGPNMSGKSTYLRQVGLLAVMAMCGCFVPAEYASFRIHDALLTRLSNDDDLERSLSTFASEMASSAMILGIATSRSLVLIDELGRGTSPREGVGISHAIAERLVDLKPFVFFATHFSELTKTLSKQPTVVNLHLSVQRSRASSSSFGMTFQYKILDGTSDDFNHYGIELARLADLPPDVLSEGKRVAENLAALQTQQEVSSETHKTAIRRKALLKLQTQLTHAYKHSALPDRDLLAYVARFQADIVKAFLPTTKNV
ncbi:muts domain V-domain-containing protein [Crepidotus variabilis]|uniref:DNA mismatch repair protein MSH3 n=1 Tax=Crepidotus variabilis TaxID=179855 RepID=A0A9P6E706_9AGAR|nr:muts domain V-domain-containing protein [Crepidotus variabilis]